ncbi:MAG: L-Ala-D/L-Glu epimerase [Solirubrobacteraceae bacterium]|nr:L-Ala-D/L-Glu epimerase [Solirubrobacteraceae bacterium]
MKATLETIAYRFRRPLVTSYGTLERRELLLLRLEMGGTRGVGEAAPLPAYDGVSLDEVRQALAPALADLQAYTEGSAARVAQPQAAAALEVALQDHAARSTNVPIASLLADAPTATIPVNATIAATDPAEAAREAADATAASFSCVKLKVGLAGDIDRVTAVRDAVGPDVAIRVDANGAWTVEEALAALEGLGAAGLELCEEPVRGVQAHADLRERLNGAVRIAMDESAADPAAWGSGATDAMCLKVAACGGISRLLDAANEARAAGSDVYVASTYDGPVGIAAGLHAAAALGVTLPCGLVTLPLFEDLDDPFPAGDGAIALPRAPGLGLPD